MTPTLEIGPLDADSYRYIYEKVWSTPKALFNQSVENVDVIKVFLSPRSPPQEKNHIAERCFIVWRSAHCVVLCKGDYRKNEVRKGSTQNTQDDTYNEGCSF